MLGYDNKNTLDNNREKIKKPRYVNNIENILIQDEQFEFWAKRGIINL